MLMIVLGLGLAILIHELGHFLAAKRAGVRVDRFSIGFGPRIWGFTRGETEYRLSLVLFAGGYVKLAGESAQQAKSDDPRLFMNKTPGVRAVVFLAGVAMNALLGLVFFIVIFSAGYPFILPEVGTVEPGSPAEEAGLLEGDLIIEIDGRGDLDYEDVRMAEVFSKPGREVRLLVTRRGESAPVELKILPVKEDTDDFPRWGLAEPPASLVVEWVDPDSPMSVRDLIRPGDRIMSADGKPLSSWRELFEVMADKPGEEIDVEIERAGQPLATTLTVGTFRDYDIGIDADGGLIVTKVVSGRPAELAGLAAGDLITRIDGKEMRSWKDIRAALNAGAGAPATVTVQRVTGGEAKVQEIVITPDPNRPSQWTDAPGYMPRHVFGIDVAFPSNVVGAVREGSDAWLAGLRANDKLVAINTEDKRGKSRRREVDRLTPGHEMDIDTWLNEGTTVTLEWLRDGNTMKGKLAGSDSTTLAKLQILPRMKMFHRDMSGLRPVRLAFRKSYYTVVSIVRAVRSIAGGTINPKKAFAGPARLVQLSYRVAQRGLMQFLYLLGIININLAFVNLLPIPILDGGHLLFVAIEKARGKRLSERTMEVAQFVGLALLLALFLFVMYADFSEIFR